MVASEGDHINGRAGNLYYLALYRITVLALAVEYGEVSNNLVDFAQTQVTIFSCPVMQVQQGGLGVSGIDAYLSGW